MTGYGEKNVIYKRGFPTFVFHLYKLSFILTFDQIEVNFVLHQKKNLNGK